MEKKATGCHRLVCMSFCNKTAPCHDLAKQLSHYLYFFFFSFLFLLDLQLQDRAQEKVSHDFVTMSQWCDGGSQMVTSQVTVTVCHMTKVIWGPWESKCIATVVKCISSREMSKNSIEFSLSNSKQRDSWLNSGYQTLDADKYGSYQLICLISQPILIALRHDWHQSKGLFEGFL